MIHAFVKCRLVALAFVDRFIYTHIPIQWIVETGIHQVDYHKPILNMMWITSSMYIVHLAKMLATCESHELSLIALVMTTLMYAYAKFDRYQAVQLALTCAWFMISWRCLNCALIEFMLNNFIMRVLYYDGMMKYYRLCGPPRLKLKFRDYYGSKWTVSEFDPVAAKSNLCAWKCIFDDPEEAQRWLCVTRDGSMTANQLNSFSDEGIVQLWSKDGRHVRGEGEERSSKRLSAESNRADVIDNCTALKKDNECELLPTFNEKMITEFRNWCVGFTRFQKATVLLAIQNICCGPFTNKGMIAMFILMRVVQCCCGFIVRLLKDKYTNDKVAVSLYDRCVNLTVTQRCVFVVFALNNQYGPFNNSGMIAFMVFVYSIVRCCLAILSMFGMKNYPAKQRECVVFVEKGHATSDIPKEYSMAVTTSSYSGENVGATETKSLIEEHIVKLNKNILSLESTIGSYNAQNMMIMAACEMGERECNVLKKLRNKPSLDDSTEAEIRVAYLRDDWSVYDISTDKFLTHDVNLPTLERNPGRHVLVWTDKGFDYASWVCNADNEIVMTNKKTIKSRRVLVMRELSSRSGRNYIAWVRRSLSVNPHRTSARNEATHMPKHFVEERRLNMRNCIAITLQNDIRYKSDPTISAAKIEESLFSSAVNFDNYNDSETRHYRMEEYLRINSMTKLKTRDDDKRRVVHESVPTVQYMMCAYVSKCVMCSRSACGVMSEERCGHFFHEECVINESKCPICNKTLTIRRRVKFPPTKLAALLALNAESAPTDVSNMMRIVGEPSNDEVIVIAMLNRTTPDAIMRKMEGYFPNIKSRRNLLLDELADFMPPD